MNGASLFKMIFAPVLAFGGVSDVGALAEPSPRRLARPSGFASPMPRSLTTEQRQKLAAAREQMIARIRVFWNGCSAGGGVEVSKLRATVVFSLDRQGAVTVIAEPQITGINDNNRYYAASFGGCAKKAIRSAAPFAELPVELYDHWKTSKLNFRKE